MLIIILMSVALIAILLTMDDSGFKTMLISLLCSGIAGLIVSVFTDFPGIISSTTQATANAFSSMDFLKMYSNDCLETFKKKAILLRYNKGKEEEGIVPDIIRMESQLCDLLDKPYYEFYSESHSFSTHDGKQIKTITVDYLLKNSNEGQTARIDIGILKYFPQSYSPEAVSQFIMDDFVLSIDNSERKSIAKHIHKVLSPANDEDDLNRRAYNSAFRFYFNGELNENNFAEFCRTGLATNPSNSKKGMIVSFTKEVEVNAVYTIPFDKDLFFAKKLRYFAKSFTFDSDSPDGYGIHGSILSPFAPSKKTLVSVAKRKLQIECRTGLLPGSGIFCGFYKES